MKSFEVTKNGLQELRRDEIASINGGCWWVVGLVILITALIAIASEFAYEEMER